MDKINSAIEESIERFERAVMVLDYEYVFLNIKLAPLDKIKILLIF